MPTETNEHWVACDYCGESVLSSDIANCEIDGATAHLCPNCVGRDLFRCGLCDGLEARDLGHQVRVAVGRDSLVCESCFESDEVADCEVCGRTYYVESDECADGCCPDCYDEGFRRCEQCNELTTSLNEDGYCESCAESRSSRGDRRYEGVDESAGVLEHFYHPPRGWLRIKEENEIETPEHPLIYLGFELEVDHFEGSSSVRRCAQTLAEHDKCFCKHDGSLVNGFELVCHPRTLMSHKHAGWQKKLQQICAAGARSNDTTTCGLHVHVNRSALSDVLWLDVVDSFVNRNRDKLIAFSRRHSGRFSGFDSDLSTENRVAAKRGAYRYTALNFAPKYTREFRTFRGTLSYHTLIATLEFVDALVSYAQKFKVEPCWEALAAYMAQDVPRYAECIDYMQVRMLWPSPEVEKSEKAEKVENKEVK